MCGRDGSVGSKGVAAVSDDCNRDNQEIIVVKVKIEIVEVEVVELVGRKW